MPRINFFFISLLCLISSFLPSFSRALNGPGNCSFVSVTVESLLRTGCKSTLYCYVFTSTKDVMVNSWTVSGNSLFTGVSVSSSGINLETPGKVFSNTLLQIRPGITYKKCFEVALYSATALGKLNLTMKSDLCTADILVPTIGIKCDCELNMDPSAIIAGACSASCINNLPLAEGVETATRPVIRPAVNTGVCTSTFIRPCNKKCPVNCVKTLDAPPQCNVACGNPDSTYTQYYTTITTASNGGTGCDDKVYQTGICKQSNSCPVDCVMRQDILGAKCDECCDARCDGIRDEVDGKRKCTKSTLVAPLNDGAQCTSTTTFVDCKKVCPKDCVVSTPDTSTIPCPANEEKPTSSYTLYGTIIQEPKNGGRACPVDLALGVITCSLKMIDGQVYGGKDCIVDGWPQDACAERCSASRVLNGNNAVIPIFTAEATYPATLAYPDAGGKPCPTLTRTCNCNDCSLEVTPTKIQGCDATCLALDGSFAMGKLTQYFSITEAARNGGKCTTAFNVPCSTYCSCKYRQSITKECAYTSTDTRFKTWTAYGQAEVTPVAEYPSCDTIRHVACSKVLKPMHCAYNVLCPNCKCPPNAEEGNYAVAQTLTCDIDIVSFAKNNGSPCPTTGTATRTCKLNCPGCSYSLTPICHCTPTDSNTQKNDLISYVGQQVCTYPLLNQIPQVNFGVPLEQNSNNNLCPERVDPYMKDECTFATPTSECWVKTASCGRCTMTAKLQQGNTYYGIGLKTCDLSDFRGALAPAKCIKNAVSRVDCTQRIPATNCRAVTVCAPCVPTCEPNDEGLRMFQAPCYLRTLTVAQFGGTPCPIVDIDNTQCSTTCTASAAMFGAPSAIDNSAMNAFFAADLTMEHSSVGGRLIVCGSGTLADVSVGEQVEQLRVNCDYENPMLYVNNDLLMMGSVFAGETYVRGNCSSSIVSKCGQRCASRKSSDSLLDTFERNATNDPLKSEVKCFQLSIDCPKITKWVSELSAAFALEPPNAAYSASGRSALMIMWDVERSKQVLWITDDSSNPLLPFNEYNTPDPPNGPILINVFGDVITMRAFSLRYLANRAENVFWNFPDAKIINFQDITIFGTVLAPNAIVQGNGQIVGKLYAKTHAGTRGNSLQLRLPGAKGGKIGMF